MTAAGAYDISTEHAILVEASAAGIWQAIPAAVLFGVFLGVLYDGFRILSAVLGLCEDVSGKGRFHGILVRLRQYRCPPIRQRLCKEADSQKLPDDKPRRIPAHMMQFVLDIFYFLLCGVLGAVFLYGCNYGILRWYLMVGGCIGFLAYSRSVSRMVMAVGMLIPAAARAFLCAVYRVVLYPPLRLCDRGLCALAAIMKKTAGRIGRQIREKQKRRRAGRRVPCSTEPTEAQPQRTKQQKRSGSKWQKKRNNQRKK